MGPCTRGLWHGGSISLAVHHCPCLRICPHRGLRTLLVTRQTTSVWGGGPTAGEVSGAHLGLADAIILLSRHHQHLWEKRRQVREDDVAWEEKKQKEPLWQAGPPETSCVTPIPVQVHWGACLGSAHLEGTGVGAKGRPWRPPGAPSPGMVLHLVWVEKG